MDAPIAYVAGFVALFGVTLLALVRGDRLERQVAIVVAAAWLASAVAPLGERISPPWMIVAIDVALFFYLAYHAAFSRRIWPIAAAGFMLLILANHAAFALNWELKQWAYFSAYYIWSWGVLLSIALGVLTRRRPANDLPASATTSP